MVKYPSANTRDAGLISGLGRPPEEGNGNPLQYSCLGNPMDRGAWWARVLHIVSLHMSCSDEERQKILNRYLIKLKIKITLYFRPFEGKKNYFYSHKKILIS